MAKPKKRWIYSPPKPPKPRVPDALKAEVLAHGQALVAEWSAEFVKPPPEDLQFNYLIGVWCKWYRNYFYLGGTYASPGPNALSPTFEAWFSRLEYVGDRHFNLAYMRHTGQWWEVFRDLPLEDAFQTLRTEPYFFPIP
jgi:hypothetical protein